MKLPSNFRLTMYALMLLFSVGLLFSTDASYYQVTTLHQDDSEENSNEDDSDEDDSDEDDSDEDDSDDDDSDEDDSDDDDSDEDDSDEDDSDEDDSDEDDSDEDDSDDDDSDDDDSDDDDSDNPEALLGLALSEVSVEVEAGKSHSFTAYGEFSTQEVPVKVAWTLSDDMGDLNCNEESAKKCNFHAGDEPGETTLTITSSDGLTDSALITIIEPLKNKFKDELPGWANVGIIRLQELGIILGYQDGTYGPGDPLSRAQIVTLLFRLLDHEERVDNSLTEGQECDVFTDVTSDHFAYEPLCYFHYSSWLDVEEGGAFDPDGNATRGLTSFYVHNAVGDILEEELGVSEVRDISFEDVPPSHRFYNSIRALNAFGIMRGYDSGLFGADNTVNRAEAAVILFRVKLLLDYLDAIDEEEEEIADEDEDEDTDDDGNGETDDPDDFDEDGTPNDEDDTDDDGDSETDNPNDSDEDGM